jgi:hypothetical protein
MQVMVPTWAGGYTIRECWQPLGAGRNYTLLPSPGDMGEYSAACEAFLRWGARGLSLAPTSAGLQRRRMP